MGYSVQSKISKAMIRHDKENLGYTATQMFSGSKLDLHVWISATGIFAKHEKDRLYDGSKLNWIWGDPDMPDMDERKYLKEMVDMTRINPKHLGHDKENIGRVTICGTAGEIKLNSFSEMWKNLKP
jgi:hypothetical protein